MAAAYWALALILATNLTFTAAAATIRTPRNLVMITALRVASIACGAGAMVALVVAALQLIGPVA